MAQALPFASDGEWLVVDELIPSGVAARVRFRLDPESGRKVPVGVQVSAVDGRLRGDDLRRFRLDLAEAWANGAPRVGSGNSVALSRPPEGRCTDDWYRTLANAYNNAVGVWRQHGGEPPAKALAEQAGVSVNTVRSWVYRARRAGWLPKGSQGRVG